MKTIFPFRVRSVFWAAHREFVFRRAMKRFLKDPRACARPGSRVVSDLVYGWGNQGWSAREEYLSGCIDQALNTNGPILECGSGLSTILVGVVAKRRGHYHLALEHTPDWALKVRSYLARYKLDSKVLQTKPLRDYGDFAWYDAPLESMPRGFSLVVCDGPPGGTKGGRYGLVPIMKEHLEPGCVILLDDAGRDHELAIAKRWAAELGASFLIHGTRKPYIEMKVAHRPHQAEGSGS